MLSKQSITVPIDENGVIDPDEKIEYIIETTMSDTFGTEDVFIYSHGWWTSADAALKEYNVANTQFSSRLRLDSDGLATPPVKSFSIGVHWPSMLEEDPKSLLNKFELFSFYKMEKRADTVGRNGVYAMLRLLLSAAATEKRDIRLHLFGHSFGCKVVCAALQRLAEDKIAVPSNISFNVILLQAAFKTIALDGSGDYAKIIPFFGNKLRLLITYSQKDTAVMVGFPLAQAVNNLVELLPVKVDTLAAYKLPTVGLLPALLAGLSEKEKTMLQNRLRAKKGAQSYVLAGDNFVGDDVAGDNFAGVNFGDFVKKIASDLSITGLGATGPTKETANAFSQSTKSVQVDIGSTFLGVGKQAPPRFIAADLTPYHDNKSNVDYVEDASGHHSDIFFKELYDLMGWFLFGSAKI